MSMMDILPEDLLLVRLRIVHMRLTCRRRPSIRTFRQRELVALMLTDLSEVRGASESPLRSFVIMHSSKHR